MVSDKAELLSILQNNRNCIPVGTNRVRTRCVLCGDSKRDPNKKRLYILCDPEDRGAPVVYNCFNCGEHDVLNTEMLPLILGSDSEEESRLLRRINKAAKQESGSSRVNKYRGSKTIDVVIPPPRKIDNTIRKIKYMNKRIGFVVPLEDYGKFKLVFSIKEFLRINNIPIASKYERVIDLYERDYIGWLSVKNEYLILRDITGKNKYRYVKYNLFGIQSNAHSFFTVQNGINTISQNPIRFVVAEGPFDIMSIVYNIFGGIQADHIFMSTNHGAFLNPLLYYINKGLVGSNIYIDIYRDSDSIMDYSLLKNQMKIYTKNFRVYQNSIGKDFGVPKGEFEIERVL